MLITEISQFTNWLSLNRTSVMSIDFETTSLLYTEMEFVGFSVCNTDEEVCYVTCDIGEIPDADNTMWVMHNAQFDLTCWYKFWNQEPSYIFCTLIASQLLNENLFEHGLKYLAGYYLCATDVVTFEEVGHDMNSQQFVDYAEKDAIYTIQLYKLFSVELRKEKLTHVFYKVEMPFQYVLSDLNINGILVYKEKLAQVQKEVLDLIDEFTIKMCELSGVGYWYDYDLWNNPVLNTTINFNSPQQMVKLTEEVFGIEIIERTKPSKKYPQGQKSFNVGTKKRLLDMHPFFKEYDKYCQLKDLYSSFIGPCEKFIESDGRIRTSYAMKRTGRLSSSKPNLQNQPNPKKKKLLYNYRTLFIPRKGYVIVKADYSGQELRNLAEVSQDRTMIDAFNKNYDLHLFTANRVFNLQLSDESLRNGTESHGEAVRVHKRIRHQAKNGINFPIIYGSGEWSIAKNNGVSVAEAKRWLNEFLELYPGVPKAIELTKREIEKDLFVRTIMGRKRRFPDYWELNKFDKFHVHRQAFNFKIQGFSADQMKVAAAYARKVCRKYGAYIVLTVHDELVFECPEYCSKEFAKELKYVMEQCVLISVPVIVDVSIVSNYGE